MATELSRRGFLTGAMAAAALGAFPFGDKKEDVAPVVPEVTAMPEAVPPFIVIHDEWGFYMDSAWQETVLSGARTNYAPIEIEQQPFALRDMMLAA